MKIFKNVLIALAFVSLTVLLSCGGTDEPDPDPEGKSTAEALAGKSWIPSSITNENTPRDEWTGFSVSFTTNDAFTGGNYTAGPLPAEDDAILVWKTSGTWAFKENADSSLNLGTIIRDGDTAVEVIITPSVNADGTSGTLRVAFNTPDPAARLDGFFGNWVFNFAF
ncbi:MAG: hypothetical protein ACI8QD_001622 [Cyclobacteriaceae bacterium]|jgi:hypothetical protein